MKTTRRKKPAEARRRPVTMTIGLRELAQLDELALRAGLNRSRMVSALIALETIRDEAMRKNDEH